MKMGRLIRKDDGIIIIEKYCFSSCIFILIGGVERQVLGKIGIHRLFLDPDSNKLTNDVSSDKIKTAINQLVADAIAYVTEMNVPRKIVDDMMSIPSDSIKLLTLNDLFHYGILPLDPLKEKHKIAEAKLFGISHGEYLARKSFIRQKMLSG